ncbi:MAG: riboflavin synthase [Pseudomonadota bacterium]
MFTGIIKALGTIASSEPRDGGARMVIQSEQLTGFNIRLGDSVAINGVCLTALEPTSNQFAADASAETLRLTSLGRLQPGDRVNLEPALKASDPLGGHLVSGHVDGQATLVMLEAEGESWRMRFEVATKLARYIVHKGSVTLNGVSLTVNQVERNQFEVNLIPHTWQVTTLNQLQPGDCVNLEVDQIARYLERLLAARQHPSNDDQQGSSDR